MYLPGISISNPGFIVFGEASSKKKVKLMIMGMVLVMFMLKLIVMLIGMVRVTGSTMVTVGMLLTVTIIIPAVMSMGMRMLSKWY